MVIGTDCIGNLKSNGYTISFMSTFQNGISLILFSEEIWGKSVKDGHYMEHQVF